MPILVKDNIDVRSLYTTAGSLTLILENSIRTDEYKEAMEARSEIKKSVSCRTVAGKGDQKYHMSYFEIENKLSDFEGQAACSFHRLDKHHTS